ncbi:hypothetical protein GGE65_007709 [Skermanella aerolata]|uniref:hypothetical protein n=1 Tax=Skermanella aerolata TaxID=393310 RepID=UPI003D1939E1
MTYADTPREIEHRRGMTQDLGNVIQMMVWDRTGDRELHVEIDPDNLDLYFSHPYLPGGWIMPLSTTLDDLLSRVDSLMQSIRDRSVMSSWYAGVVGDLLKSRT